MKYTYKTKGTCSQKITFDIEDGVVRNVEFLGGCSGNTKCIAQLCVGMKVNDVCNRLKGIKCGFKNTSCPDQLARALSQYNQNS